MPRKAKAETTPAEKDATVAEGAAETAKPVKPAKKAAAKAARKPRRKGRRARKRLPPPSRSTRRATSP